MDTTHLRAKTCTKCGEVKPISEFYKDNSKLEGVRGDCKCCTLLRMSSYKSANRDLVLAQKSKYYENNKELCATKQATYYQDNKDKFFSYKAKRRAVKLTAKVMWANSAEIVELYVLSRFLSKSTGVKHEVDHIIPLQHPLVCGLHVETNLQILTKEENARKGNKFTPGIQPPL